MKPNTVNITTYTATTTLNNNHNDEDDDVDFNTVVVHSECFLLVPGAIDIITNKRHHQKSPTLTITMTTTIANNNINVGNILPKSAICATNHNNNNNNDDDADAGDDDDAGDLQFHQGPHSNDGTTNTNDKCHYFSVRTRFGSGYKVDWASITTETELEVSYNKSLSLSSSSSVLCSLGKWMFTISRDHLLLPVMVPIFRTTRSNNDHNHHRPASTCTCCYNNCPKYQCSSNISLPYSSSSFSFLSSLSPLISALTFAASQTLSTTITSNTIVHNCQSTDFTSTLMLRSNCLRIGSGISLLSSTHSAHSIINARSNSNSNSYQHYQISPSLLIPLTISRVIRVLLCLITLLSMISSHRILADRNRFSKYYYYKTIYNLLLL